MKRLFFVLALSIFSLASHAQKDEADLATRIVLEEGVRLPAIKATHVMNGDVINLSDLKFADLKYSDKPTLIIAWAKNWCGGVCYRRIDTILSSGLDKAYNILTLNVEDNTVAAGFEDEKIGASVMLPDIRKIIIDRTGWNRIQHYQVNFYQFREAFQKGENGSTPFFILLDKNLRVVNTFSGYSLPVQRYADLLADIDKERVSASAATLYFDNMGLLTTKQESYYYMMRSKQGNSATLKTYFTKGNRLFSDVTFANIKGVYVKDGIEKTFFEDGKPNIDAVYSNGQLTRGKSWFNNGELRADFTTPLSGPGFSKLWREDGTMDTQATYKDGQLHGVLRRYDEKGLVSEEAPYVAGKLNGIYKKYKEGKLISETAYKDDKLVIK